MNDNFFNVLGLCRKAGRLSWGRDTCKESIRKHKAKLIIIASDVSERIKKEFSELSEQENIDILFIEEDMSRIGQSVSLTAGVFTVNDEGFAKLLKKNSQ